jgi:NAD(P)-dependent dehydrogenase (short-subunit alcohol dehydrogenase family)
MTLKTVIVTGGSRGIGRTIVEKFLVNGWNVVSGARSQQEGFSNQYSGTYIPIQVDVSVRQSHIELVTSAIRETGRLDCYVNNAGFSEWKSLSEIDERFLHQILETNLMGYFWGAQAAAAVLGPGGSIVNISSIAGKRGTANNSGYVATKFGVTGLTQSLCKELGRNGVRVNAVCPVLTVTPGLLDALESSSSPAGGKIEEFFSHFIESQTALGRLPTLQEVANVVFFLASSESSAITGQSIHVDCGVLPN